LLVLACPHPAHSSFADYEDEEEDEEEEEDDDE
jgi:hypothetical protein